MAQRIQLRREKGWRLADYSTNAVIVDRRGTYGNPFLIQQDRTLERPWIVWWSDVGPIHSLHESQRDARQAAVNLFRRWLLTPGIDPDVWPSQYATAREHVLARAAYARGDLAGKDVACWCPLSEPCHGDVWLELSKEAS